jgi:hypothetical protein
MNHIWVVAYLVSELVEHRPVVVKLLLQAFRKGDIRLTSWQSHITYRQTGNLRKDLHKLFERHPFAIGDELLARGAVE